MIQELYRHRCYETGDVNEHLPLLYMLSLESEGVAEFGVARGISTSALLAGQETRIQRGLIASYRGVDITQDCNAEIKRLSLLCSNELPATFVKASSTEIQTIEPVDLLFIDSLHTEETIRKELEIHLPSVRKYVAMHDTVAFGENGETPGTKGILYGIESLLTKSWLKIYDSPRNNGMVVFRRVV